MARCASVILVNYNGWRLLDRALQALETTRGVDFDVIVVDNLSSDGSREKVAIHHPHVRLITMDHNAGFGAANLAGVESTDAEYVVFLNNDTEVTPDWLERLVEPLAVDPEIGASCSTLLLLEEPHLLNATGAAMAKVGHGYDRGFRTRYMPRERGPSWEDVFAPTGAAMLMRRHDFLAMDGFDSAMFMYHEDVDLGWRLWLSGRRVVLCHQSIVKHHCGATTNSLRGHRWKELRGMRHCARTIFKCYEWPNALYAVGKQWGNRWHERDYYGVLHMALWNLWNAPSLFNQRIALQRNRPFPDASFFEKGLISHDDFPPSIHDTPGDFSRPLIVRHRIPVAAHSAESNLIDGWHGPENSYGSDVRWTTKSATCRLQADPNQTGTLGVQVRLPPQALTHREIAVQCGNERAAVHVTTEWTTIELPNAQADQEGRLILTIHAHGWRAFDLDGSPDYRELGCMVEHIVFKPDAAKPACAPQEVSVIIPTFNRRRFLMETLDALGVQTWRDFEVIVVDDGSTDDTWERLQQWKPPPASSMRLRTFRTPNPKPASARKYGLSHASGEVVIFLGDDMIPSPDFVEQHMAAHLRYGEPCAVIGFSRWDVARMKVTPFLESVQHLGYQFNYSNAVEGREVMFTQFYGSNVSVDRSLLNAALFGDAFTSAGWEDTELGYRLHRLGAPIIFAAKACTAHWHPYTLSGFLERQKREGAASPMFYKLYLELQYHPLTTPGAPHLPFPWNFLSKPFIQPLWKALDRMGFQLPSGLCRALLDSAFHTGRLTQSKAEKERD